MNKKYNIGFDIGSHSVGWAVLDEDLRISRFKNQSMWGSRLFKESESAAERRLYRNTRRRYKRRSFRLHHLQQLMDPMIQPVDEGFFQKLENSSFHKDGAYNLFDEINYNDKDFFEKFKTVYHLRSHLMTSKEKEDPRLIYLALHHLVKYRGHFLFEGQNLDLNSAETINDSLEYLFEGKSEEVLVILLSDSNNSDKNKDVKKLYKNEEKTVQDYYQELTKLITNLKTNFKKMSLAVSEAEVTISNKSIQEIYEKEDEIESFFNEIPEELEPIIQESFKVYSWLLLQESLRGYTSISEAKIQQYNDHKEDLCKTKNLLKLTGKQKEFFKTKEKGYDRYINGPKKTSQEDVNKELIKLLKPDINKIDKHKYFNYVWDRANENLLFPLQRTSDNSVIPYQVHLDEFKKIIENQSVHYPYLKENERKFEQVFTYRIPYFVGPVNTKSQYSTAVLHKNEAITPFNFEEVVNLEASAEKFILDRTSFCTYLPKEYVLPKSSIYYQMYEVYNELNGLRINGDKASKKLKNAIVDDLFKKYKTISDSRLKNYLVKEGYFEAHDVIEIKGYQSSNKFSTSLSTYINLKDNFNIEEDLEMLEDLILWNTIFTDKDILNKKICSAYPNLSSKQIEKILMQNFTGWGRLSKRLLVDLQSQHTEQSILDILKDDTKVFMQIINDQKHKFIETINEEQKKAFDEYENTQEIIDSMYASPRVKSSLWQTLKLLKEIIEIKGYEPEQVFIEFAREEQNKGRRTQSRRVQLINAYMNISDGKEIVKELEKYSDTDMSERLYLYYLQKGKCAYSQKGLNISNLSSYQIDHIIPQSIVKDDSLDNKVLVISKENQRKSNLLFLHPETIQRNYIFWESLKESKLMSSKKFFNLTRRGDDKDEQKAIEGFIHRQLVETRQTSKFFRNIVENLYPNVNVVPLRAKVVSDYRKENNFYKSRNLNNFHHAKDAYLIAALGAFSVTKYPYMFDSNKFYNRERYNKHNLGIHYLIHKEHIDQDSNKVIWNGKRSKEMIKKMMKQNDVIVTAQVYETKGPLYNETIYKKDDNKAKIPRNKLMQDTSKYGGHSGLVPAYMAIVEGLDRKGTSTYKLINIPVLYKNNEKQLKQYIKEEYKIDFVRYIKNKIYKNTLVETDGMKVRLGSASEWNNAVEMFFNDNTNEIIYRLENNFKLQEQEYYFLYTEIIKKIKNHYPIFSGLAEKMENQAKEFNELTEEDKRKVLLQLLNALKASKGRENIKYDNFNLGSSVGRISGKNLRLEDSYIINESITGLYRNHWSL